MVVEVKVPKENVSDDRVVITEWHISSGSMVKKGQTIVSVESSKAIYDIEAPQKVYVHYKYSIGKEIKVGEVISVVSTTPKYTFKNKNNKSNLKDTINKTTSKKSKIESKNRFSNKAEKMIKEFKINKNVFEKVGMVTEKVVLSYIEKNNSEKKSQLEIITKKSKKINGILILGAGATARVCIDIILKSNKYSIIGIIDPEIALGEKILGIPVVGRDNDLEYFVRNGTKLIVNSLGIVYNHKHREEHYKQLDELGFSMPNIIHSTATIEKSARIGKGNIILANTIIGTSVKIMNNCIVNNGSIISHDTFLDDNVHIAPGAILAGYVNIGKNTLIGMGSTIYYRTKIGENVTIFNGVNIFKDVKNGVTIKQDQVLS